MSTLAAIGKKALLLLLGDKKGRKAIGYTVGIALFLALLPLIVVTGLFHWLCGDGGEDQRGRMENEAESGYTEAVIEPDGERGGKRIYGGSHRTGHPKRRYSG